MSVTLSNLDANQVLRASFDDEKGKLALVNASGLIPNEHDEIDLSYTGDDLTTVTYKLGGSTVATLPITYDVPGGKITNVTRS